VSHCEDFDELSRLIGKAEIEEPFALLAPLLIGSQLLLSNAVKAISSVWRIVSKTSLTCNMLLSGNGVPCNLTNVN
jgi:hypothetical protein